MYFVPVFDQYNKKTRLKIHQTKNAPMIFETRFYDKYRFKSILNPRGSTQIFPLANGNTYLFYGLARKVRNC